jgi:hypothetical protein
VFGWRYLDGGADEVGASEEFEDRAAAEAWLGEAWEDLLLRGVEEVVLEDRDRDRTIYRMGLREA